MISARRLSLLALTGIAIFSLVRLFDLPIQSFFSRFFVYGMLFSGTALFLYAVWQLSEAPPSTTVGTLRKFPTVHAWDPLLSMRGLACVMVLMGHSVLIAFPPAALSQRLQNSWKLWLMTASPWTGVWIFFVLSGYLMGKGFYSGRYSADFYGIKAFFHNRILRIVPLYIFVLLIVACIAHPEAFDLKNIRVLFHYLIFDFNGVHRTGSIIDALWSISTEMQFYFLVPFVFIGVGEWTTFKNPMRAIALLVAVLSFGLIYRNVTLWFNVGGNDWVTYVYTPLIGNLDLFLCGFFLNPIIQFLRLRQKWVPHGVSVGIFILGAVYAVSAYACAHGVLLSNAGWHRALFYVFPTATGILIAFTIALFELSRPIQTSEFHAVRWLVRATQIFGTLTYAIYVWHEPVYLAASTHFIPGSPLSSLLTMAFNIVKVLCIALLSYYLVERPFEKIKIRGHLSAMDDAASSSPVLGTAPSNLVHQKS